VFGALAAAGALARALRLPPDWRSRLRSGLPAAMASGIHRYLAEGTWTKRMTRRLGGAIRIARGADGTRGVRRPRTCSKERTGFIGHSRRLRRLIEPLLTGLERRG